jgi:hypothetical protein
MRLSMRTIVSAGASVLIVLAISSAPLHAQVVEPTRQPQPAVQVPVATADHRFGIGGRLGGSTFGLGASLRGWMTTRAGFEFQVSRWSEGFAGLGVGLTQFATLFVLRLPYQPEPDDVVLRPYAGGGLNFFRASISLTGFGVESDSSVGVQVTGGVEILFRDAPRFVVSTDIGFHSTGVLLDIVSVGGLAIGVSGHWYFR